MVRAVVPLRESGLLVVIIVLAAGLLVWGGPRSADADIHDPGAYTAFGHIARNVPLGDPIRVCSSFPKAAAVAVKDINDQLRRSGFTQTFHVFQWMGASTYTSTGATDRIDYVLMRTGSCLQKPGKPLPRACIMFDDSILSGAPLYTIHGEVLVKVTSFPFR